MQEKYEHFNPATGCDRCPVLAKERHTVVWGRGPAKADVMLIGEAPGFNEDRESKPFVGRSGQLIDKLLLDVGLPPYEVHFTNRVMCRPPGNRDPEPQEIANCEPWLTQHIRDVNPLGVILVGRFAIGWKFGKEVVGDVRGLMIRTDCDACGGASDSHRGVYAKDGTWHRLVTFPERAFACSSELQRERVYLATYHPAAALRDPTRTDDIAADLERFKREVDRLRGERA